MRGEIEAAILNQEVREGRLTRERVQTAALAGHPVARSMFTDVPELPPLRAAISIGPLRFRRKRELRDLEARLFALGRFGVEPCLQAALAATMLLKPTWETVDQAVGPLEGIRRESSGERASGRTAMWCADLVLRRRLLPQAIDAAVLEHLRQWGVGRCERPRWGSPIRGGKWSDEGGGAIEKLALRLVEDAKRSQVARVRLDPEAARLIHVRPDGSEVERMRLPLRAHPPLAARYLFLAGLDPLPAAGAQEGQIEEWGVSLRTRPDAPIDAWELSLSAAS